LPPIKTGESSVRRIERKGLRAPARVLDLELAPDAQPDESVISVGRYEAIWCLPRAGGIPREISFWDVTGDETLCLQRLRDQLRADGSAGSQSSPGPPPQQPGSQVVTVVICTRDRPAGLRATLASLRRQTDAGFCVLVVDNGSSSPDTATAVAESGLPRCEYVMEPRRGLARARNRALRAVSTELVAWIDDDEVADPGWIHRLKEGFAHSANPAAVCGVMLPAELESEAQVRFEQYGGFNKGRGMAPEVLRMRTASVTSPLYPLPAFGPGGNMAFRTESLRAVAGFDPCLGAGTRTHGGEETRALSLLLSSGHAVLHWPAAITWHTHRREMAALRKQFYGYSAGLSAFYASMIRSRPTAALDMLGLAPHVLRDLRRGGQNLRFGHLPEDFPPYLLKAARRGLLAGGFMYTYEAIRDRRESRAARRGGAVSDAAYP
jgi:glycosyltransferase involved in cell wall biosynthesis